MSDAAVQVMLEELRDWYAVPSDIVLAVREVRASPTPRQFGVVVAVLPKRSASPTPGTESSSATTPQPEEGEATNGTAVSAEELPTIQACLEALSRGSGSQEIESGRLPRTAQTLQVPYVHVEVKRCSPPSSVVKEEPPLSERIEAARVRAAELRVEHDALNAAAREQRSKWQWYFLMGA